MNSHEQMSSALLADAPNEQLKEKLNLFGQFVGEWDFDCIVYNTDGTTQKEKGEWLFNWALEGRAIQDVWIIPSRENRSKQGLPEGEYGTTLRFYSPEDDHWKIVWVGPLRNRLNTFIANKIDDEIVLEATNTDKFQMKWILSKITINQFHWRSIISDDGKEWKMVQEMTVRRKK